MKEDLCYIQRMEVKFLTDMDPGVATPLKKLIHCKTLFCVTLTIILSSQLHAYCVCDMSKLTCFSL